LLVASAPTFFVVEMAGVISKFEKAILVCPTLLRTPRFLPCAAPGRRRYAPAQSASSAIAEDLW
jgi:hypothetical protein